MIDDLKYGGPVATVDLLAKQLQGLGYSKDAQILDFGCGSGMVGEELNKQGYTNIDGVDLSEELMAIAKEKGIYKSLILGEMASDGCKKLNVAADQYDAATCVGVLTHGHVKGKGFDDFVHALKPGGVACFTVRRLVLEDPSYGYTAKMDELCEAKKWKLLEKKYVENYTVDDGCWLFCCQKL
jgi:predicted TPR repeat methyltransferase